MLEYVYSHIENHDALGLHSLGAQHNLPLPRHYHERNTESELVPVPDADANGSLDCFDSFVFLPGDNHCGYRLLHPLLSFRCGPILFYFDSDQSQRW
jgi:hypothetical protein